jgi:polyferredoxin
MIQSFRNIGRSAFVVVALVGASVLTAHLRAEPPRMRRIHIDLFRYGSDPETIVAARGDTLVLTFSARDTPHSFFLEEYGLDVKVTPNSGTVEVADPRRPAETPVVAREVVLIAGRPGLLGFLTGKSRFRCHVYCGEMHAFEQGTLVVRPNVLAAGAWGVLAAIPILTWLRIRRRPETSAQERFLFANVLERRPRLRRWLAIPDLQLRLMTAMSILAYGVLLTSLLGTKMAGGNLGVLLTWVVWLFLLVVVLVPLGGRAWCTACPIPLFGDLLQRRHSTTHGRPWPRRLANRIPRTLFFLAFGTVSILVVSQPRWTGWSLVVLVALATVLPLAFELRAFCRHLCPINGFISAYAPLGLLSLRARRTLVCHKCQERGLRTCNTGNTCGRACPYGLTVSEIDTNAECGLCLECLRTCSYKNVTLHCRVGGLDRLLRTRDEALQAIVLFVLAIVYCLVFLGPWHRVRDMINVVDKDNWRLFGLYAAALWMLALVIAPGVVYAAAAVGRRLARSRGSVWEHFAPTASALIPMGLSVWIAFAVAMFFTEASFVLSAASDPFGWGWNLFGTAGRPWRQIAPEWVPAIQCAIVLVGFGLSLRVVHRAWIERAAGNHEALRGAVPFGVSLFLVAGGLIGFFAG